MQAQALLTQFSNIVQGVKEFSFDESLLFGQMSKEQEKQKNFIKYFREIQEALNCVDCKKCKVYGKMQIEGLGVALKILMKKAQKVS